MRLVLASNNAKKLAELRALLARPAAGPAGRRAALGIAEAEEPHATFVENALAKARHAARGRRRRGDRRRLRAVRRRARRRAGRDLGARRGPGGRRRPTARPRAARRTRPTTRWLLQRLAGAADRRARFVSTLVALRHADDPEPLIAFGRWEGEILAAPRGEGGFGYDPLMFIPALGATVAELPPADEERAQPPRAGRGADALR